MSDPLFRHCRIPLGVADRPDLRNLAFDLSSMRGRIRNHCCSYPEVDPIQRILLHIGEPAASPRIAPARAPPDWIETDFDKTVLNDSEEADPIPEIDKLSG